MTGGFHQHSSQGGNKKLYHVPVKRLLDVVEALDGNDSSHNFEPWKKMVEERSGSFPAGVKRFWLNKLLGARPGEIARMEDVKSPSGVRGMIIRYPINHGAGRFPSSRRTRKKLKRPRPGVRIKGKTKGEVRQEQGDDQRWAAGGLCS